MSPEGQKLTSWPLFETEDAEGISPLPPSADKRPWKIVWQNVAALTLLHLGAIYGAYLSLTKAMWATNLFAFLLVECSGLGITAGAHRLWAHKSYKARLPLRESMISWVRNHRVHHKYSETDADPHNATRGFFFSHIGWLLIKKHPDIIAKGHTIDMSDLKADPILQFQHKYYVVLVLLACFVLPTYVPTLWGESAWNAFFVSGIFRYILILNAAFLVNSAAHKWGYKPYDKSIKPVNCMPLSLIIFGEGAHNYHHTFPWDYKTDELGQFPWNLTRFFIDTMAKIGWAYDLKTVSSDVIEKRVKRTGDGSHEKWGDIGAYEVRNTMPPSNSKSN